MLTAVAGRVNNRNRRASKHKIRGCWGGPRYQHPADLIQCGVEVAVEFTTAVIHSLQSYRYSAE